MKTGLAREYGSANSRNKRDRLGVRRFIRAVGHTFVTRPACGCAPGKGSHEVPRICPDCGGAALTPEESTLG